MAHVGPIPTHAEWPLGNPWRRPRPTRFSRAAAWQACAHVRLRLVGTTGSRSSRSTTRATACTAASVVVPLTVQVRAALRYRSRRASPGPGRATRTRRFARSDSRHSGCLSPLAITLIEESLGLEGIRKSRDTRARPLCENPPLQAAVLVDAREVLGCGNQRHRANLGHFDSAGTSGSRRTLLHERNRQDRAIADATIRSSGARGIASGRGQAGKRHCVATRRQQNNLLKTPSAANVFSLFHRLGLSARALVPMF
jgi:hypothetical protein